MEDNPFGEPQTKVVQVDNDSELDFLKVVRRLAEIDDEIKSRGLDPLLKEKEELRELLKKHMLKDKRDEVYDETSNWEAVFVQRFEDSWNVSVLKKMLKPAQRARYIVEQVLPKGVAEGIKTGDLSRVILEKGGAVKRSPKGKPALYVREKKQEEEVVPD
ncbi:hypothetical protein LCGC14_2123590 [marine sediment metagenome]|uniref:Uncharacterized protein n=1 Tax=marine sediment metagenome TaxID=412755 RepID=A0A0F9GGL2_9ZZZZ